MDAEERISIEKRMIEMERELATHGALLARNSEILDDIRNHLNEPRRTPEWIAALLGTLACAGGVLYAAYIAPLEARVSRAEIEVELLDKAISTIEKDHIISQQMFRDTWEKIRDKPPPT